MKFFTCFLATIMAAFLLAGCGGGTPAEPGPLTSDQKAAAEREAKEVEDAERAQQRLSSPAAKK